MTLHPDEATWVEKNREALLVVTSGVARDLLPPGLFDSTRPARPNQPDNLDIAIQAGYVFIREEWTGTTSSGDSLTGFPEEMVHHHCTLRVLMAAECVTEAIAAHVNAVRNLERDPRPMDRKGREMSDAMRMLDLEMDEAIRANQLEGTLETIYQLVATLDPAEAFRVPLPRHLE